MQETYTGWNFRAGATMEGVVIFTVSRRITITRPLRWRQTAESASVVIATRQWFLQIPTLN